MTLNSAYKKPFPEHTLYPVFYKQNLVARRQKSRSLRHGWRLFRSRSHFVMLLRLVPVHAVLFFLAPLSCAEFTVRTKCTIRHLSSRSNFISISTKDYTDEVTTRKKRKGCDAKMNRYYSDLSGLTGVVAVY